MKKTIIALCVTVFMGLTSFSVQAQTEFPVNLEAMSSWVNQRGSIFTIDSYDTKTGLLTGVFINKASGYSCQNTPYNVTGYIHGNAITFTVNWNNAIESCNSITAWTGFYASGVITTEWQLVINGSTKPTQIVKGSDSFSQVSMIQNKSLLKK